MPVHVSLNDIDTDEYSRFDRLGKSLTTELSTDLRRTKIVAKRLTDRNVKVGVEAAADEISATFVMDVPLETSRQILLEHVMAVKGVAQRPAEIGAAQRIVARVIDAMGEDAAPSLSAFMERCAQRLQAEVSAALRDANTGQVSYEDTVELVALEKMRFARKRQLDGHPTEGSTATSPSTGGNGTSTHMPGSTPARVSRGQRDRCGEQRRRLGSPAPQRHPHHLDRRRPPVQPRPRRTRGDQKGASTAGSSKPRPTRTSPATRSSASAAAPAGGPTSSTPLRRSKTSNGTTCSSPNVTSTMPKAPGSR